MSAKIGGAGRGGHPGKRLTTTDYEGVKNGCIEYIR